MTNGLINLLFFSALFGLGVFFIVLSPTWGRAKRGLDRMDEIREAADDTPVGDVSFVADLRKRGLDKALAQAGLPVTPAQFIRFGVLIAVISGSLILSLIGSFIVAGFVTAGSIVLYVRWLYGRRDQVRMDYEKAVGSACEFMGVGAQRSNTVEGALSHSLDLVDPILRDDFEEVINLLQQNASLSNSFAQVQRKRQSQSLNMLAETLIVWSGRGSKQSLTDVLSPLRLSIQKSTSTVLKMDAELSGPKRSMIIVAIAPIIFVVMLRLSSPAIANFYSTLTGELLQIIAYSISIIGVILGERSLERVRKVIEIEYDV